MDPHLAHFYAAGLLRAFRDNGYIINLDIHLFVKAPASESDKHPCYPWHVGDPLYAYKGLTYAQYEQQIYLMYWAEGGKHTKVQVDAMIAAYGLRFPAFIDEIILMATGELLSAMKNDSNWSAGIGLSYYYTYIKNTFPVLCDSFSWVSIASKDIECVFTRATSATDPNSVKSTNSAALSFCINAHGGIKREMQIKARLRPQDVVETVSSTDRVSYDEDSDLEEDEDVVKKGLSIKELKAANINALRNKDGLYKYFVSLYEYIDQLNTLEHFSCVTVHSARGGKLGLKKNL